VYHNVAVVYYFLNRPEEALESNDKALALALKLGSKFHAAHIERSNAVSYLLLEQPDKALESANAALDYSLEIGVNSEEAESRMILGAALREKGDWEAAETEFGKSRAIIDEISIEDKLGRLLYEHGLLHKARGENDAAREKLAQALDILEKKGMKTWVDRARKALEDL
jgi:tetratricopeptide (TPR) repeat protein